ncbi:MAG: phosphomannomutase/phosphoglucomutase [Pseudomonadota bacterium]|nr:phosphomannomutase/phosphoglucomutase [Pseudomonadota bacterium]
MKAKPETSGSTRLGILPLAATLAALQILILGAAGWWYWNQTLEPQAQVVGVALSQQAADRQAEVIDQRVSALRQSLAHMGTLPEVQAAMRNRDPGTLAQLESSLTDLVPDAIRVTPIPLGSAGEDLHPDAPIGFANLEMVVRAERGDAVPPEVHRHGQRQLLYMVVPVDGSAEGTRIGTLLAAFDARLVLQALVAHGVSDGATSLIQRIPGVPPITVMRQGDQHSTDPALSVQSDNPYWTVQFTPGALSAMERWRISAPDWWLMRMVEALALVLLVCLALALLQRRVSHDAAELTRYLKERFAGHDTHLSKLRTPLLDTIGQWVFRLTGEAAVGRDATRRALTEDAPSGPAVAPTAPAPANRPPEPQVETTSAPTAKPTPPATPTPAHPSPPDEIFRAYDIRGIAGQTLTEEGARLIGQAIGSAVFEQGEQRVLVGRDGRESSPWLAKALMEGLRASGRDVIDLGEVATPMLYFASHELDMGAAVMVTGSHNPAEYNGFKVLHGHQPLSEDEIQGLRERISTGQLLAGNGRYETRDITDAYIEQVCNDVALVTGNPKVVVDCANGIGGRFMPRLLDQLGCEVVPLHCEVDGTFPNHPPDPTRPEHLSALREAVLANKADLGLALDGDGDRVVCVTAQGQVVPSDRLLMLFVRDVLVRHPGADVLFDVKSSRLLGRVISECGGRPVMGRSGHSMMKRKMRETGAVLGAEFSGHFFFQDRWYGFDDGLYAGARLIELLATEVESLDNLLELLPSSCATPELLIAVPESDKFALVEALSQRADFGTGVVERIDGIRVDYPNGWGLVRPSNTGPALTLRFEGDDEAALEQVQALFRTALQKVAPGLALPF